MSMVGSFPGLRELHRRTVRGPINPLDKSTIVSIYPKEIDEVKHTIQPGRFIIKPGSYDKPSTLVVGPSSWWREIDEDQPLLEIPVHSVQIADSIVRDYCNGIFGCDMDTKMPGLFYIPGQVTVDEIKKKYSHELDKALTRQRNLYHQLITFADALWARSNGNPMAISDDMRMAARELGIENKDWLRNFKAMEMARCFACGSLKNPEYPICATCRTVDPNHPKAKEVRQLPPSA